LVRKQIVILLFTVLQFALPARLCAAAQEGPFALIFVIDGIPNDLFMQMLEQGELPNFRTHIYERGIHSKHHVSVFPPLTFPAMASIFSGYYPSSHKVPNFFWVDREQARYKSYLSALLPQYQSDLEENVRFLFDFFPRRRTLSFGLPLNIGGDYTRHLTSSFIDIFREFRDLDYVGKTVKQEHAIAPDMLIKPLKTLALLNPAKETNVISLLNPASPSGILRYSLASFSPTTRALRRQIPAAVLYYEWAPDHFGHEDGPWSDDVRDSLIEADTQFGRLVRVYQQAEIYDRTFFFLLSDHGQIPVDPKYVRIDRLFQKKGFKAQFVSHELIAKSGLSGLLRIRSVLIGSGSIKGYNCALGTAGGGSVVAFLSKNGGTKAEDWREQVYYEDLLSYPLGSSRHVNLIQFITSIDGMNFFLVRENEFVPGEPHETRVVSRSGSSRVRAKVRNGKPVEIGYELIEGKDPLEYMQNPSLAAFIREGHHGDMEWLEATAETAYPDAPVQIAQIMETPRSGSVIMVPDDYHSFNARTWSKHGGLSASEMLTTFAVAGPGIRHGSIDHSRVIDFVPTFLHLMGRNVPTGYFDGMVLENIIAETEAGPP